MLVSEQFTLIVPFKGEQYNVDVSKFGPTYTITPKDSAFQHLTGNTLEFGVSFGGEAEDIQFKTEIMRMIKERMD